MKKHMKKWLALAMAAIMLCSMALPVMAAEHDWRPLVMLGLSLVFGFIGMVDDWTKIKKKQNKGLTALQKLLPLFQFRDQLIPLPFFHRSQKLGQSQPVPVQKGPDKALCLSGNLRTLG